MSRKIIGVTVGTSLSPSKIEDELKPVKTVNGKSPDENGNVEVEGGTGGESGKDGITPQLRINGDTNEWEVSYDYGVTWASFDVKATGEKGDKGDKGDTGDTGATGATGSVDLLSAHPVGSLYVSNDPTSPAVLFGGGNWLQIKGAYIVAADNDASSGAIPTYYGSQKGGSADAVVVSHSHYVTQGGLGVYNINSNAGAGNGWYIGTTDSSLSGGESSRLKTDTIGESGVGKNLSPYYANFVWQRYPDDAVIS